MQFMNDESNLDSYKGFEHASFHCPCLGEPDCCWFLQLS